MAGSERNRGSFDNFTPDEYGSKPRVNLPASFLQPSVPPHSIYHTASAEPNPMSLNNYFPSLPATPQVQLPPRHTYDYSASNKKRSMAVPNDLEGRLRGMILSNGIPESPLSLQTNPYGSPGSSTFTLGRSNQAQQSQQMPQPKGIVLGNSLNNRQTHNPMSKALDPTRNILPTQGPDVRYQYPHLRGSANRPVQSDDNDRSRGNHHLPTPAQPSSHGAVSQPSLASSVRNQAYTRPPPTNRQLYNPGSYGIQAQQGDRHRGHPSRVSTETQIGYLESLANCEILKALISDEELLEKQALRQRLEQVCRKAVSEYEMNKVRDTVFVPDSVELRCFGSLSTTFATKSSDMDLVLVSPMSKPETSSSDSDLPRVIEKTLLDLGYGARFLTRTRIPIIRFCEKPTPELATLLLAERTKFEKERDLPVETKAQKTPKVTLRDSEKPNMPLPQDRPTDLADDETVTGTVGSEAAKRDDDRDSNVSESAKVSDRPLSDMAQIKQGSSSQKDEELVKKPMDYRERDDPTLAEKSDVERARLYNLAIQDGWYEPVERQVIRQFLSALKRHDALQFGGEPLYKPQNETSGSCNSRYIQDEQLNKARAALQGLPNVIGRYRPPPAAHPLDFPKEGIGIQCDINFSNHLALHNSHLLKCYASCDPRVRRMVLFVKAWSKKRKINTPYHGTLSSYGYVLMVLHYLVNIANPPVLPNLQASRLKLQDEMSAKEVSLEGYNIHFFRNEGKILDFAHRGQITLNRESLGSLLLGFFHYFARQGYGTPSGGFAWTLDTLSLRTIGGIISKKAKGWTGAKTETVDLSGPGSQTKEIRQRYLFAIEDPFEIDHNIARTVVHNGIIAIRDEFRRAHMLIQNAGGVPGRGAEDLFAEADEKENLQYRPFGPRPKKDTSAGQDGSVKATGPITECQGSHPLLVNAHGK